MYLMLQQPTGDDFVLATGVTTSVRAFTEYVAMALDLEIQWDGEGLTEKGRDRKTGKILVEIDEKYFRPAEVDLLLGDPSKAKKELGWTAKTGVKQLAEMMARFDMDHVGRDTG